MVKRITCAALIGIILFGLIGLCIGAIVSAQGEFRIEFGFVKQPVDGEYIFELGEPVMIAISVQNTGAEPLKVPRFTVKSRKTELLNSLELEIIDEEGNRVRYSGAILDTLVIPKVEIPPSQTREFMVDVFKFYGQDLIQSLDARTSCRFSLKGLLYFLDSAIPYETDVSEFRIERYPDVSDETIEGLSNALGAVLGGWLEEAIDEYEAIDSNLELTSPLKKWIKYRVAEAYEQLGDYQSASEVYHYILSDYPDSYAAVLAQQEIQYLQSLMAGLEITDILLSPTEPRADEIVTVTTTVSNPSDKAAKNMSLLLEVDGEFVDRTTFDIAASQALDIPHSWKAVAGAHVIGLEVLDPRGETITYSEKVIEVSPVQPIPTWVWISIALAAALLAAAFAVWHRTARKRAADFRVREPPTEGRI